jgi:hypothetical protein
MFGCRRSYKGPRYSVRRLNLSISRHKDLRDLVLEGLLLGDYFIVWDNEKKKKVPYAGYRTHERAWKRAKGLNTQPAPWNSTHARL